jgi:hypothetical protein
MTVLAFPASTFFSQHEALLGVFPIDEARMVKGYYVMLKNPRVRRGIEVRLWVNANVP